MAKPARFNTEPTNERVPAWKRAVAVGTLSASALFAVGCSPQGEPLPTETEKPSPVATETATATPELSLEEQIEALKIPVGLSDQELATSYIELKNEWWNAGATNELSTDRLEANVSWGDFLPSVVAENTQLYAPAVYGADWQTNSEVQTVLSNNIAANLNLLTNYVATAWSDDPENKEPYSSHMELTNVENIGETETSRTLEMTYSNIDNSENNAVIDNALPQSEIVRVTFTEVDGSEVVTSSAVK